MRRTLMDILRKLWGHGSYTSTGKSPVPPERFLQTQRDVPQPGDGQPRRRAYGGNAHQRRLERRANARRVLKGSAA